MSRAMPIRCYVAPYSKQTVNLSLRLTEDGEGSMRSGNVLFCYDDKSAESADWLFVGDKAYDDFYTVVPRARRILSFMEPTAIRRYTREYIEQFGIIISPYKPEDYTGVWIEGNPCLGWFAGVCFGSGKATVSGDDVSIFKKISDVEKYTVKEKIKDISIVSSLKNMCEGHTARIAFLEALRAKFGDRIDYYGREFCPIDDKLDAIAPYKYHISVENSRERGYWTEKLTDAWIGWSLPLYCGDPSILEQVPDPDGIEIIDIYDIQSAVAKIEQILRDDPYQDRLESIKKCREWAIKESNPHERICRIIETVDETVLSVPRLTKMDKIRTITGGGLKGSLYKVVSRFLGRNITEHLYQLYKKA